MKAVFELLRDTFQEWQKDNAPRLAAALTYYTIFSMAPIFLIVLAVASLVLGPQAAHGQLVSQVQGFIGPAGAQVVESLLENAARPGAGIIATVVSVVTVILGASGLFAELQAALNLIWDIHAPAPKGFLGGVLVMVKERLRDFVVVLLGGVILLITFALGVAVSAAGSVIQSVWPAGTTYVLQAITFGITFVLMAVVFAIIFRILPDATVTWGDVWIGALFTSLLFSIGRLLIGLYMGMTTVGSAYGAAGSLIALLIWVNYSAQIFYLGAEFTQVYSRKHGSRSIHPAKTATSTLSSS